MMMKVPVEALLRVLLLWRRIAAATRAITTLLYLYLTISMSIICLTTVVIVPVPVADATTTTNMFFNMSRIQTNGFGRIIINRTDEPYDSYFFQNMKVILLDENEHEHNEDDDEDDVVVVGLYWTQSESSRVEIRLLPTGGGGGGRPAGQDIINIRNNLPWEYYGHVDSLNPFLPSLITSVGTGFCHNILGNYCSLGIRLLELEFDLISYNITKLALDIYKICSNFFGLIYCQAWIRYNSTLDVDVHSLLQTNQCPGVGGGPKKSSTYHCPQIIGTNSFLEINGRRIMENNKPVVVWLNSGRLEPTYSWVELSAFNPEDRRSNDDPVVKFQTLLPFQPGTRYELNTVDPKCGWDIISNNDDNNPYSDNDDDSTFVIVDINGTRCNMPNGHVDILDVEYDLTTTWPKRFAMDLVVDCPNILIDDNNLTIRVRYQYSNNNVEEEEEKNDLLISTTTDLTGKRDQASAISQQQQQQPRDNDDSSSSSSSSSFAILYKRYARDSLRRMDVRHVEGNYTTNNNEGEGGGENQYALEVSMDGYHIVLHANQSISPGYQIFDQTMQYPSGDYEYPCNVQGLIQQNSGLHFYGRQAYMCSCYRLRWTAMIHELDYYDDDDDDDPVDNDDSNYNGGKKRVLQKLAMDFHFQCDTRESKLERFGWIRLNSNYPLQRIPVLGQTHFSDCVRDIHFDIVTNSRHGLIIPPSDDDSDNNNGGGASASQPPQTPTPTISPIMLPTTSIPTTKVATSSNNEQQQSHNPSSQSPVIGTVELTTSSIPTITSFPSFTETTTTTTSLSSRPTNLFRLTPFAVACTIVVVMMYLF